MATTVSVALPPGAALVPCGDVVMIGGSVAAMSIGNFRILENSPKEWRFGVYSRTTVRK